MRDDVRHLFGSKPDFDCRYRSYEIWYYRSPNASVVYNFDGVGLECGARVQSLADLPDVYDYVQLAFDANGHLHAYTWIGESYTIERANGPAKGSHFKLAPESFEGSERFNGTPVKAGKE